MKTIIRGRPRPSPTAFGYTSMMRPRLHPFVPTLARLKSTAHQHSAEAHTIPHTQEKMPSVDFSNSQVAYASKSIWDLARGIFVFQLCTFKPLVRNAELLMKISYSILGTGLTNYLAKLTFFGHFCAGEDRKSIAPTVNQLEALGVGSILDYAAESDVADDDESTPAPTSTPTNVKAPVQCRVYDYSSEEKCNEHLKIFSNCIKSVKEVSPTGFAAIKVTALGNPLLLERMSTALVEVKNLFQKFDTNGDGTVTREEFTCAYDQFFTDTNTPQMFQLIDKLDPYRTGTIDYIEWANQIRLQELASFTRNCRQQGPLSLASLDENELQLMLSMRKRTHDLASLAHTLGVRLMIDAEHSYFQPAIDSIVCELQQKFNVSYPAIFNTYQLYLKDTFGRMIVDITRAERNGFYFAAKIVRGAYLVLEKAHAKEMGIPDPLHPSITHTHEDYHRAINELLTRMARGGKIEVMIASHNQDSVNYAIQRMQELSLPPQAGVYFGQLLGMSDHLTFSLGHHGYKAYKYVPYGPVQDVMPYLIRRAQENSDVLGGTKLDLKLLQHEFMRRLGVA